MHSQSGRIPGLTGGKHSYIQEAAIAEKILWMPDSVCRHPPKQALSTVFAPPQVNDTNATEPHILPKVYIGNALPEEPSGIVTGRPEPNLAMHGVHMEPFSMRLFTWNLSPNGFACCNP